MKLTNSKAKHLRKVMNFVLKFEEADYYDWLRDTNTVVGERHVYYHAKQLIYADVPRSGKALTDKEVEHLGEVISFVLEFEKESWLESLSKKHIYYAAMQLVDSLEEHRIQNEN